MVPLYQGALPYFLLFFSMCLFYPMHAAGFSATSTFEDPVGTQFGLKALALNGLTVAAATRSETFVDAENGATVHTGPQVKLYNISNEGKNITFTQVLTFNHSGSIHQETRSPGVFIAGNTLLCTIRMDDKQEYNSGTAYIYHRDNLTATFRLHTQLYPPYPVRNLYFGVTGHLAYHHIFIGTSNKTVYSYHYDNVTSQWDLTEAIQPPAGKYGNANLSTGNFGVGFATYHEDITMITDFQDMTAAIAAGAVHVYRRNGAGRWLWNQTLLPTLVTIGAQFGYGIASSPSGVMIAQLSTGSTSDRNSLLSWYQLDPSSASFVFTSRVTLSTDGMTLSGLRNIQLADPGGVSILALPYNYYSAGSFYNVGAVRTYRLTASGAWVSTQLLRLGTSEVGQDFGDPIAMTPEYLISGCRFCSRVLFAVFEQQLCHSSQCPEHAFCSGYEECTCIEGFEMQAGVCNLLTSSQAVPSKCANDLDDTNCPEGYDGVCCLECASDYYRDSQLCLKCSQQDDAEIYPLLIASAFLFAIFVLCVFICNDVQLDNLVLSLITVQFVAEVGKLADSNLPEFMQVFYSYFALITLDYNFARPQCFVGWFNFYYLFYGTLLIFPIVLLPMVGGLAGVGGVRSVFFRKRSMKKKVLIYYACRIVRATYWLLEIVYFIVVFRSLQVFSCADEFGYPPGLEKASHYYLVADPIIECYTPQYFLMLSIAAIILVVFGVGYPLAVTLFLLFGKKLFKYSPVRMMLGCLYEGYRKYMYFVAMIEFLPAFFMAVAGAWLWWSPELQFVVSVIPVLCLLLVCIFLFPYLAVWESILQITVLMTTVLALCLILVVSSFMDMVPQFLVVLFTYIVFVLSVFCLIYMLVVLVYLAIRGFISQFKFSKTVKARSKERAYGVSLNVETQGADEDTPISELNEDEVEPLDPATNVPMSSVQLEDVEDPNLPNLVPLGSWSKIKLSVGASSRFRSASRPLPAIVPGAIYGGQSSLNDDEGPPPLVAVRSVGPLSPSAPSDAMGPEAKLPPLPTLQRRELPRLMSDDVTDMSAFEMRRSTFAAGDQPPRLAPIRNLPSLRLPSVSSSNTNTSESTNSNSE